MSFRFTDAPCRVFDAGAAVFFRFRYTPLRRQNISYAAMSRRQPFSSAAFQDIYFRRILRW